MLAAVNAAALAGGGCIDSCSTSKKTMHICMVVLPMPTQANLTNLGSCRSLIIIDSLGVD